MNPSATQSVPPSATPRTNKEDPWAHRRGEPRLFTLFWTIYLLGATAVSIATVGLHGAVLEEGARVAARMILQTAAIGMVVLWPLTRLSQMRPERTGVGWAVQDTLAVLIPLQAVIWPHIPLAKWSALHAGASACVLAAWASLIGALLAVALSRGSPGALARTVWMMVFIVLLALAPGVAMILQVADQPLGAAAAWLQMGSPMTAIDELAPRRGWHGSATITRQHWAAIGLTVVAGAITWLIALARARGERAAERLR